MRSQPGKYESGIHYSAPVEARECGRFNPPGGQIAVLYAADASITAMAEMYGRRCQLEGSVIYPESVLDRHYLCAVETLRTVKVIDMIEILQYMHIPFSDLEGEDYRLPQWLMARLYADYGETFDGIAYDSRHRRYKKCYAFWRQPGRTIPFRDTPGGMWTLREYKEYDSAIFPSGWAESYMTGEALLEEGLNFQIASDPY
ncbi:RES family NAD+ phosphorylase [Nissabacter archeti]|uniref:RES family NAD+ phosphorylase n=1 Tax=Nissabacter archeti TaxID=1917880 RepID=A0ABS5JHD8_9GAMM|nr:RES family NAD+ phosphorylase [Nissabacter archeti]MBS0969373.1 RES family NAD+ phosphorylase [Nissabacter archeti]